MSEITRDTLIGEVLESKKGADEVIRRHLGNGCFTCPAVATEPLGMGAVMHGADLEAILAELNALPDGSSDVRIGPPQEERKPLLSRIFGKKQKRT